MPITILVTFLALLAVEEMLVALGVFVILLKEAELLHQIMKFQKEIVSTSTMLPMKWVTKWAVPTLLLLVMKVQIRKKNPEAEQLLWDMPELQEKQTCSHIATLIFIQLVFSKLQIM